MQRAKAAGAGHPVDHPPRQRPRLGRLLAIKARRDGVRRLVRSLFTRRPRWSRFLIAIRRNNTAGQLRPNSPRDYGRTDTRRPAGVRRAGRRRSGEFAEHRVDVQQRLVHAPARRRRSRRARPGVGTVAPFAHRFDRGEVHVVAVAIAKEQRVRHVAALLQPVGVVREELARPAHGPCRR